jgi:hypothetical protein
MKKGNATNVGQEDEKRHACGKEACLIQICLEKWNYQESKCRVVIDEWRKCINKGISADKS